MDKFKARTIRILLTLYTLVMLGLFIGLGSALTSTETQAQSVGDSCTSAAQCAGIRCPYPQNSYCNFNSDTCECLTPQEQQAIDTNGACYPEQGWSVLENLTCPNGAEPCGYSFDDQSQLEGCFPVGGALASCNSCGNTSEVQLYCRNVEVPECYEFCTNDSGCGPGLVCDYGRGQICVNPENPDSPTCDPIDQNLPFCGDALCNSGELCERTSEGVDSYRACTQVGGAPTGEVVASCRNIQSSPDQNTQPYACTYCGDGIRQDIEECDYAIDQNCNQNCTLQELEEGISIDKTVLDDRVYMVGEQIRFNIRITNTGETTLNVVRFRDSWNATYLRFLGGSVIKSTGEQIDDITPLISSQTNSEFVINDVTNSILGNLAPNQYYQFELVFSANAPTPDYAPETCNDAFVRGDDLPEISDDDCVPIDNRDTDI